MLFCTTNFPVLRRTRPDAKCIVLPKHCVFRKISYDRTAYTQNCVSPDSLNRISETKRLETRSNLYYTHRCNIRKLKTIVKGKNKKTRSSPGRFGFAVYSPRGMPYGIHTVDSCDLHS